MQGKVPQGAFPFASSAPSFAEAPLEPLPRAQERGWGHRNQVKWISRRSRSRRQVHPDKLNSTPHPPFGHLLPCTGEGTKPGVSCSMVGSRPPKHKSRSQAHPDKLKSAPHPPFGHLLPCTGEGTKPGVSCSMVGSRPPKQKSRRQGHPDKLNRAPHPPFGHLLPCTGEGTKPGVSCSMVVVGHRNRKGAKGAFSVHPVHVINACSAGCTSWPGTPPWRRPR